MKFPLHSRLSSERADATRAHRRKNLFAIVLFAILFQCNCGGTSAPSSTTTPPSLTVSIQPTGVAIVTGAAQVFTATVSATGTSSGTSSEGVAWSVEGILGGNSIVGTITATDTSGSAFTAMYLAPGAVPSTNPVTITATSLADSSKSASTSIAISCATANSIAPLAANVALGQTQNFTASFCVPAGASITWDVNGVLGGNSTLGTISPDTGNPNIGMPDVAVYTAPINLPSQNFLTIHAIATSGVIAGAATLTTLSATVTVTSNVMVAISPLSATLSFNQRATFAALVANTSNSSVTWSVDGIVNGNPAVGQICQSGINPCAPPSVPASGSVDYLAPTSVPTPNPVTISTTSSADLSRTASALITISGPQIPVAIAVAPGYAFLAPGGTTVRFYATVTGTSNTSVTWTLQSAISGEGCSGAACGSITVSGLYSAPVVGPSPNSMSVIATSAADPTKSASATVALTTSPVIEEIVPSSVIAGAVASFAVSLRGANFIAGSGSSASLVLLNGAARSATCASPSTCTIALGPSDVQSPGTLTLQIQNPGAVPSLSNRVPFVVAPFSVTQTTISLTTEQPAAAPSDITVTEPTTEAAMSSLNVDFIGFLSANTCGAQVSPLTVTRPPSGSTMVSLCIHGNALDPAFTYAFTGPASAPDGQDIGVSASSVPGLFSNVIELDLQITNTTKPGVRSLFITTLNNDRAVATGILEVK